MAGYPRAARGTRPSGHKFWHPCFSYACSLSYFLQLAYSGFLEIMSRRVRFHAKPNVGSVKTNAAIVNKPNKKSLKDDLSTQNETEKELSSSKISEKQFIQFQSNNPLTPVELTRTSEKTNSEKADESSKNLKVPSDQPSTSEETTNQVRTWFLVYYYYYF